MLSDMDRPSIRLNLVSLSFARKGAGALTCPAGRLRRDRRPREPALSGVEGSLLAQLAKVFVIPYVVRGAECRASMADFTLADTSSVSRTVNPAVEIGSPTRISSGWHLMW